MMVMEIVGGVLGAVMGVMWLRGRAKRRRHAQLVSAVEGRHRQINKGGGF